MTSEVFNFSLIVIFKKVVFKIVFSYSISYALRSRFKNIRNTVVFDHEWMSIQLFNTQAKREVILK
jgi:hypothetical protein